MIMDNCEQVENRSKENFKDWLTNLCTFYKNQLTEQERIETLNKLIKMSSPNQLYMLANQTDFMLKRDFLQCLPKEITEHLLSFFDIRTLLIACQVSKPWNAIINENLTLWKFLIKKEGIDASCVKVVDKQLYLKCLKFLDQLVSGEAFQRDYLLGHTNRIMAIYYYCGTIATGSDDRTVCLWDAESNICVKIIPTHSVSAIKFDDKYLVTASYDTTAACWDITDGHQLQHYRGHVSSVFCIDYNSPVDILVTGSADSTVKIWSFSGGQLWRSLSHTADTGWISCVRLYPNSNSYHIVSSNGENVYCWSVDSSSHDANYTALYSNSVAQSRLLGLDFDESTVTISTLEKGDCADMKQIIRENKINICDQTDTRLIDTYTFQLPQDSAIRTYLGSGSCFCAYIIERPNPVLYLIRKRISPSAGTRPFAEISIPANYRESKRGASLILGDRKWLNGLDCNSLTARNDVVFVTALQNDSVLLLKFNKMC